MSLTLHALTTFGENSTALLHDEKIFDFLYIFLDKTATGCNIVIIIEILTTAVSDGCENLFERCNRLRRF